jgi:hypothetical protein
MLVKFVSESVYNVLSWGKERCCKVEQNMGHRAVLVRIADRWARQMKVMLRRCEQEKCVSNNCRF